MLLKLAAEQISLQLEKKVTVRRRTHEGFLLHESVFLFPTCDHHHHQNQLLALKRKLFPASGRSLLYSWFLCLFRLKAEVAGHALPQLATCSEEKKKKKENKAKRKRKKNKRNKNKRIPH